VILQSFVRVAVSGRATINLSSILRFGKKNRHDPLATATMAVLLEFSL
jgi:hypothetical protein